MDSHNSPISPNSVQNVLEFQDRLDRIRTDEEAEHFIRKRLITFAGHGPLDLIEQLATLALDHRKAQLANEAQSN